MDFLLKLLDNRLARLFLQKLDRFPNLKKRLRKYYWGLANWLSRLEAKTRASHIDNTIDLNKIYWISPNKIVYSAHWFNIYANKGKVIGGDWDLPRNWKRFEDTDIYQSLCERFLNHKSWEETKYYQRLLGLALNGQADHRYNSRTKVDQKFRTIDELYQHIKDNGYKTQGDLKPNSTNIELEDEITISIARTGELLYTNGKHRLSIAKILGLKEIPVRVTVRHSKWREFRSEILAHARRQQAGKLYQPLPHPDLADIPAIYGHERFEIIKQNLSAKTGALLDIGSLWGYFCHKFEDEGFDCYAVESDAINIYFLNRLRQAENKQFKVFQGSIFDYRERTEFDVVLALNIFYHFLKHKSTYLELIELLKRLKMKELFFQTPKQGGQKMEGAYKNYSLDEFLTFILENSCLKEAKYIGRTKNERPIYKLYS